MDTEVDRFSRVKRAIASFKEGEVVVVMDDDTRENEGDLIFAAEFSNAEKVNLLIRNTSGIICAPMTRERASELQLPPMIINNTDPRKTAFTVSVDLVKTTTGVSAAERAMTLSALSDFEHAQAKDFQRPGHIFPLVARDGGVLERRGHTEATVDLCKLAGLKPVGVLAEIMNPDGTMSRLPECLEFAKKHGLCLTTVEELAEYRQFLLEESKVKLLAECEIPLNRKGQFFGNWKMRCFQSSFDNLPHHVVLSLGDMSKNSLEDPLLVRIHSECFTGDLLGSTRCDCGEQLDRSFEIIHARGYGAIFYVAGHEGRGIGLINKIKAYKLLENDADLDTFRANELLGFPADMRSYDTPLAILKELNVKHIELITNNPLKYQAFSHMTVRVFPITSERNQYNQQYLEAKEKRFNEMQVNGEGLPISKPAPIAQANEKDLLASLESIDKAFSQPKKSVPLTLPSPANISSLRVGIVRTCWNQALVDSLFSQCKQSLLEGGIKETNIVETIVPGSFELPFAAQQLIPICDCVICFGVLIKGETMHFEYISQAVSQGLMQLQLQTGVPILYGVLNCLTPEQAAARCGTESQLPHSLALTAIHMAGLKKNFLPQHSHDKSPLAIGTTYSPPVLQPCFHA